jgi:hypothetical protein
MREKERGKKERSEGGKEGGGGKEREKGRKEGRNKENI